MKIVCIKQTILQLTTNTEQTATSATTIIIDKPFLAHTGKTVKLQSMQKLLELLKRKKNTCSIVTKIKGD